MKGYLYYFLDTGFSDGDVQCLQNEMPKFDIELTTKDELLVKADIEFEELYGQSLAITKLINNKLGKNVLHNRTITFRDL
jgi:hypothetical protein